MFLFSFQKRPLDARVCFLNPRARRGRPGGGGGRRRGPASGAFPATCQFYCYRASEFASPLAAARLAGPPNASPSPAPRDSHPGRARPAELRVAARSRERRREKRDQLGNLRERWRVAGASASLPGRTEERVDSRTWRGLPALPPPPRSAGVTSWVLKVCPTLLLFSYAPLPPFRGLSLSLVLPLP